MVTGSLQAAVCAFVARRARDVQHLFPAEQAQIAPDMPVASVDDPSPGSPEGIAQGCTCEASCIKATNQKKCIGEVPRFKNGNGVTLPRQLTICVGLGLCAMFALYRRSLSSLTALAFLTLPLFVAPSPAAAQLTAFFSVSPNGSGSQCTLESPCALQTAMANCYDQAASACDLRLNDGVYPDPGVNIYYYRKITLTGNCNAPQNVILRAMTPNTTLVWIQDHAIGIVRCLTLDAYVNGVRGIAGRQHIIADWDTVMFRAMPGGQHVVLNEYSIGSCLGQNWVMGGTGEHIAVVKSSTANIGCNIYFGPSVRLANVVSVDALSIIDAAGGAFSGYPITGAGCYSSRFSIVTPPAQGWPGPSNCQ